MTVYYVAKTGNDSNAGTDPASPKLTIDDAVDTAWRGGAGNIVEILDSEQYDEGEIQILTNAVTIRATGSNKPILDGEAGAHNYAFWSYVSGCVYQGLHMRKYDDTIIYGGNASGKSFLMSGCIAHSIMGPQYLGSGFPVGQAEVHDSWIISDRRTAVQTVNPDPVWINNSVIVSNSEGYSALKGVYNHENVTASFCTILGAGFNGSSDHYPIVNVWRGIIRNCIVSGSGNGINAYTGNSTYNLVYVDNDAFMAWDTGGGANGSTRAQNTGEIARDPEFVAGAAPTHIDIDVDNYNIGAASPANAAGVAYLSVSVDISGNVRGDPPDVGAYEFNPTWTRYLSEPDRRFGRDLTINNYKNLSADHKFRLREGTKSVANPGQMPFLYGGSGVPTIRARGKAYKVNND